MLLVKTTIGPSAIHGLGIFADQFIPKGTIIWKFQSDFDQSIDPKKVELLSEPSKKQFLTYAYLNIKTQRYTLCFDDARFFNHSEQPNTLDDALTSDKEGQTIASKDIHKGEEITCNYKDFDAQFTDY